VDVVAGGDAELGGDDMDNAIVKWLMKKHLDFMPSVREDPKFKSNLKALAEYAKIKLSTGEGVLLRRDLFKSQIPIGYLNLV